ncbi:hypothetical protein HRbin07_00238 [bacterium HR07]|nr:hypothetical protein HRbin07_00238 [bacterium HR07]
MRTRKVWGVLGLLLALVVVVGYGQQPQPLPVPGYLIKLQSFPAELVSLIKEAVADFDKASPELRLAAEINPAHAAMYVDGGSGGVIAVAPVKEIRIPSPGATAPQTIGIVGIVRWPGKQTGVYVLRLNPDGSVVLVDRAGKETMRLPPEQVKQVPIPKELLQRAGSPRVAIMPIWDEGIPRPNLSICIGWKRANCDCFGIYIGF